MNFLLRMIQNMPTRHLASGFVAVFLVLVALSPSRCHAKRLVVLAGPHHSGSSSVEQFFYHYADKHKKKAKATFGLRNWRWPHFDGTLLHDSKHPYSVMENLVTQATDEDLQQELMDGIVEAWEDTKDGLIIGTAEFDRAAEPFKQGYVALKRVVERLNPAEVTVVLNYRTPRMDQWVSMWWKQKVIKMEEQQKNLTYQEYMCNEHFFHEKEELMATAMNPMEVAQTYTNEGYNVVLMDLAGIEKAGRDVATVIACDVVGAICDDGVLRNHQDHPYVENETLEVEEAIPYSGDLEMAEMLLESRDCYYEKHLKDKVQVVHNVSVWSTCDPSRQQVYEQLDNSEILFRALLSQVECIMLPERMVTIDQALNGKIPSSEREWKAIEEGGEGGGSLFEVVMFPIILFVVGGFQMYKMNENRKEKQDKSKGAAMREAEMSEMFDETHSDSAAVREETAEKEGG